MATAEKVPMLDEGHRKLSEQVRHLKTVERPAVVEAIEAARAHGDLSENAEYHAAKERQGQIEAMIADIDDQLSRAMVIDPTTLSGDKVVFGATVTLLDEDEKKVRYQLVGQVEATIADLEDQLSRAMVIDPTTLSGDKVAFGATVTLLDEDEKKVRYQLVGQVEADATHGRISYNSPLGRALIGRQKGDEVEVTTPSGDRYYEIKKIEFI